MKRRQFFKTAGSAAAASLLMTQDISASPTEPCFKEKCKGMVIDKRYWQLVRKQFLFPGDYAYFNTGGLGASPLMVRNTVKQKMDSEDTYPSAGHDEDDWWKIKEDVARLLGPGVKKEEIAFTSSATEGINIILNGLPWKKGDRIVTSTHEHVALNVPLLNKMKTAGVEVKIFEPDLKDAMGNVRSIEKLINKRTRLIFTSHVTCTTGQVMPLKEIAQLAKSRGILFALDGAQAVGQTPLDLKAIDVDFYAFSGHKWLLGPKRTGILYVRQELLDTLKPTVVGAYSTVFNDLTKGLLEIHPSAQRYEYGTQNDALYYGLHQAVDFITAIGIANICRYDRTLAEMFYRGLEKIPGAIIFSPAQHRYRSGMITFKLKNKNYLKLAQQMDQKLFRVRNVPEAGLNGIRVSFHVYNNEAEVERFLAVIKKLSS